MHSPPGARHSRTDTCCNRRWAGACPAAAALLLLPPLPLLPSPLPLLQGIRFRLVHIDLSRKPAWYRSITPRGLVPALQHGGKVHLESADICCWIDTAFEGPRLAPADPVLRREMEQLLGGACSGVVSAGLDLMAGG